MDELSDQFGQLSTKAKEWKPAAARTTSFGSERTSSYSSQNSSSGPLSPKSPARTSGLQLSPPGRTAWQQHSSSGSGEWNAPSTPNIGTPNSYGGNWQGGAAGINTNNAPLPAWPDVTSPDPQQQHQDYAATDDSQQQHQWQQDQENLPQQLLGEGGPISIPAGPPPPPVIRSLHSMPDDLWRYHRDMAFEAQRDMDVHDPRHKAIPPAYTNAFPLDSNNNSTGNKRSTFGYPIATFKVTSRDDGHLYCLRRADNVRMSHKICTAVADKWTNAASARRLVMDHPGLVRLYKCFLAHGRAVFFVHAYCPGARTLQERFFAGSGHHHHNTPPLPEPVVWSCIAQLVAAIRAVHGGNLACRTLQLNHVLVQGDGGRIRLRINCLGVVDALEYEGRKQVHDLQREDLRDLGRLILSLATGVEITRNSDGPTIRNCDLFVTQNCSAELHNLIVQLLLPNKEPPNIFAVGNAIASHTMDELDLQQITLDRTEMALSAEYDSGRALRLMLKLGYVNERPELGMNRRWTESGDCYVLKLFRDYVFHQADEAGNPVMELGHVITTLNKLDAAEEEQIVLASRDGKTLMVVSYGDVARSLEKAYGELCNGMSMSPALRY